MQKANTCKKKITVRFLIFIRKNFEREHFLLRFNRQLNQIISYFSLID